MSIRFKPIICTAAVGWLLSFTGLKAMAEVYRWVDDRGNVHFSDRAHKHKHEQQKQKMVNAEAIKIQPVNRVDPTDSFADVYTHMKRQEPQVARKRSNQHNDRAHREKSCKRRVAEYNRYGLRGRVITYMVDENGKSLTEKQQVQELEKRRRQLVKLGCL